MQSSLKYCAAPRCPNKVPHGYCATHRKSHAAYGNRGIPGVNYGRRWGKVRAQYLAEHPFCVRCEEQGEAVLATDLDHVRPHLGNYELFWDEANFQPLCQKHHADKTWRETRERTA